MASDNVVIGCKLPQGLEIGLNGETVLLNGSNSSEIIGGYGMTTVDKEFANRWFKEFANYAPVKEGLIFHQANLESAKSAAKEREALKTGTEQKSEKELLGVTGLKV